MTARGTSFQKIHGKDEAREQYVRTYPTYAYVFATITLCASRVSTPLPAFARIPGHMKRVPLRTHRPTRLTCIPCASVVVYELVVAAQEPRF